MKETKTMKTPMSSSIKLDMDEKEAILGWILDWLKALSGFWDAYELGFQSEPRVFRFGSVFSLYLAPQGWFSFISVRLRLRVGGCSFLFDFILFLDSSFSFPSLMTPRREAGTSKAQGKRIAEPS
ncbi:hypothetical protein CK203_026437 [Vitis vinifera]|uniref:Uncharacterized protein n=1 Tax=Vitis vinifera TaxID=29760 RepID=A0A438IVX2_VITVI|nr:hypothetical protein CK203_026437 [Vitis vinifera]